MEITIQKNKKYTHVTGKGYQRWFDMDEEINQSIVFDELVEIVREYELFNEGNMESWEHNTMEHLLAFDEGYYNLNCGDFIYQINIQNVFYL